MIDTSIWTTEKIFKEILAHGMEGIQFHNNMMLFNAFCSIDIYAKVHKKRTFEETKTFIKVQNYYVDVYGKIPLISPAPIKNIISNQAQVLTYKTKDVTEEYRCRFLKETFGTWEKWEADTLELYLACMDFCLKSQCKDYALWLEMYLNTQKEYDFIVEEISKLQSIGYNIKFLK